MRLIMAASLALLGIVRALSIDNQLAVAVKHDCYERMAIGQRLSPKDVYKSFNYTTLEECRMACTQQRNACKAFSFGISVKGNATCELSVNAIKETADLKPVGTLQSTDFDLYIKKLGCSLVTDRLYERPDKPATLGNLKPAEGYKYTRPEPDNHYLPSGGPGRPQGDEVGHVQTLVSVASGPDSYLHPVHDILVSQAVGGPGEYLQERPKPDQGYHRPDLSSQGYDRPKPSGHGYQDQRPDPSDGYDRPKPSSNGYQDDRPDYHGYERPKPTNVDDSHGYDRPKPTNVDDRPKPSSHGYQDDRPDSPNPGYDRPKPSSQGYQDDRPDSPSHGYDRPKPTNVDDGQGYDRPKPSTHGYQDDRPDSPSHGYDRPKPTNVDDGQDYDRPKPSTHGYQDDRPDSPSHGYDRPKPTNVDDGQGYDRPKPSSHGYQDDRPEHPSHGYDRPKPSGHGYDRPSHFPGDGHDRPRPQIVDDRPRPSYHGYDRPHFPGDGYHNRPDRPSYGRPEDLGLGYGRPVGYERPDHWDRPGDCERPDHRHYNVDRYGSGRPNDRFAHFGPSPDPRRPIPTRYGSLIPHPDEYTRRPNDYMFQDPPKRPNFTGGLDVRGEEPGKLMVTHSVGSHGEEITSIITELKEACFRRVLAGKRVARSFVKRSPLCESVEDCQRECSDERRFPCEGFNYRLDVSGRGKGECELLSVPLSRLDIGREIYPDPDYDYYERDRNAASTNCHSRPAHSGHGYGHGHGQYGHGQYGIGPYGAGQYGADRRYDYKGLRRPGDRWIDDPYPQPPRAAPFRPHEYRPSSGNRRGDYPHRHPYDEEKKWQPYLPPRVGYPIEEKRHQYLPPKVWYDEHPSGNYLPVPKPDVKPYLPPSGDRYLPKPGGDRYVPKPIGDNYLPLPRPAGNDKYLPLPKPGDLGNHHDNSILPLEPRRHHQKDECSLRMATGFRLHKARVKKYFTVPTIYECELLCFKEKDFRCSSYAYRYTVSVAAPTDNCYLSSKDFTHLDYYVDLEPDRDFDVYTMDDRDKCEELSGRRREQSDCFWRVRSGQRLDHKIVSDSLTTSSIVECQLECLKARKFTCRSYSYRYGPPVGAGTIDNCQLTDWPFYELDPKSHFVPEDGFEVYERGSFGHGCEPDHFDVRGHRGGGHVAKAEQLCYIGFGSPARLLPQATRKALRVSSELDCKLECSRARRGTLFQCMSFSFRTAAPKSQPNCLLSDVYQRDLLPHLDYVPDPDSWLFAWDNYNPECVALAVNVDDRIDSLGSTDFYSLDTWKVYSVSGWPCRRGAFCKENEQAGFWYCELEGGDGTAWDYCCRPDHHCGASHGYPYQWCYVGPTKTQWRKCSDRYFPYVHNLIDRVDQRPFSHRPPARRPGARPDRPQAQPLEPPPRPSLDEYEAQFADEFLEPPKPGGFGQPRHWPVSYLHKETPPNVTMTVPLESVMMRMEETPSTDSKYAAIQSLIDVIKKNDLEDVKYGITNETSTENDVLLVKIPLPANFTSGSNKDLATGNGTLVAENPEKTRSQKSLGERKRSPLYRRGYVTRTNVTSPVRLRG